MMNKSDWLNRYYPVPADELADECSDETRLRHALLKWHGLVQAADYGLKIKANFLLETETDDVVLSIDGSTCALCERYYEGTEDDDYESSACPDCPIRAVLGKPCDGDNDSLYDRALKNPSLMVTVLTTALARIRHE